MVGQQTLRGCTLVSSCLLRPVGGVELGLGRRVVSGRLIDIDACDCRLPRAGGSLLLRHVLGLGVASLLAFKAHPFACEVIGPLTQYRAAGFEFGSLACARVSLVRRGARVGKHRVKLSQTLGAAFNLLREVAERAVLVRGVGFQRSLAGIERAGAFGEIGGARLQMHQAFAQPLLPRLECAHDVGAPRLVLTALPQCRVLALGVQIGRRRLPPQLVRRRRCQRRHPLRHGLLALLGLGDLSTDGVEPVPDQCDARGSQLGPQLAPMLRDLGLTPEGLEARLNFRHQIAQPIQVAARPRQPLLGLVAPGLKPPDARDILEKTSPLLRALPQRRVDLALAHDRSAASANPAGAHQIDDVAQAHPRAVEGVFAVARAKQAATDDDFRVGRRQPGVGVVEYQLHLGHARTRAGCRAAKDDVLCAPYPQRPQRLLAKRPTDGVNKVALAGSVRADHRRYAGRQLDNGAPGKCLEPLQLNSPQVHCLTASVQEAKRRACGVLLGPLLARAFTLRQLLFVDRDGHAESARVIRPAGIDQHVDRSGRALDVQPLLELGLEILVGTGPTALAEILANKWSNEGPRRVQAGVQIDGADQGFERASQHGGALTGAGHLGATPQLQMGAEPKSLGESGRGVQIDEGCPSTGQLALVVFGVTLIQQLRGYEAQDGVAQELQSLVRVGWRQVGFVDERAMDQRLPQERGIGELNAQLRFEVHRRMRRRLRRLRCHERKGRQQRLNQGSAKRMGEELCGGAASSDHDLLSPPVESAPPPDTPAHTTIDSRRCRRARCRSISPAARA